MIFTGQFSLNHQASVLPRFKVYAARVTHVSYGRPCTFASITVAEARRGRSINDHFRKRSGANKCLQQCLRAAGVRYSPAFAPAPTVSPGFCLFFAWNSVWHAHCLSAESNSSADCQKGLPPLSAELSIGLSFNSRSLLQSAGLCVGP